MGSRVVTTAPARPTARFDPSGQAGPVRTAALKPLPVLRSDAKAEDFVATADLSEHDLSGFKPMRFDSGS